MCVIIKYNICNYFFYVWRWLKDYLYIIKEFFKIISKGKICNFKSKLYLNLDYNWCRIRKNNFRVFDYGKIYLRFEIIIYYNDLVCLWLWCFIIFIVEYFVVVE